MTFTEFMSILNGEYKETAGTSAKNQCVDLANAYIKYVLDLPVIEWANAVDFPSKAGDKYEYILNSPTGVPQEGDLVIWGGTYGHIAIFIEGDANRFTSFDENYPTGSPCHVQEHNYTSPKVLGWLHPKVKPIESNQAQMDQLRAERDTNWNLYQSERQAKIDLEDALDKKNKVNESLSKENLELKGKVDSLTKEKDTLSVSLQEARNKLDSTTVELSVCNGLMSNRKTLDQYQTGELVTEIINRIMKR